MRPITWTDSLGILGVSMLKGGNGENNLYTVHRRLVMILYDFPHPLSSAWMIMMRRCSSSVFCRQTATAQNQEAQLLFNNPSKRQENSCTASLFGRILLFYLCGCCYNFQEIDGSGGGLGTRYGWRRFGGLALQHHTCQRHLVETKSCPPSRMWWDLG